MTGPSAYRALEQPGQIGAMPAEGETGELSTNSPDHAARRLAAFERLRTIALNGLPRANARVPRSQRRQRRGVRKRWWRRNVRHPEIIGNVMAMEPQLRCGAFPETVVLP